MRKGYEHPEIVMKIISVLFDYTRYEADDAEEVNDYFALNVDPTARPLVINVDYNEATYQVTEEIREALKGDLPEEEMSAIARSYYEACRRYQEGDDPSAEDWARLGIPDVGGGDPHRRRICSCCQGVSGRYGGGDPPVSERTGEGQFSADHHGRGAGKLFRYFCGRMVPAGRQGADRTDPQPEPCFLKQKSEIEKTAGRAQWYAPFRLLKNENSEN